MKDDPIAMIQAHAAAIEKEQKHWLHLREEGGNDPFWTDGCNMNLTRNHIISYKRQIAEECAETGLPYPAEYFIPTPPEVDMNFMANLNQKERVSRLTQFGQKLTTKKAKYDSAQMSLF